VPSPLQANVPIPGRPTVRPKGRAQGPLKGSALTAGVEKGRALHRTAGSRPVQMVVSTGAEALSLHEERRELICSLIGLTVKLGLVVVAGVSLCRLAGAYQERMDRQGELSAVLEIEKAQLSKARNRFDQLFMVEGEQKLIREQSQWIAPNRLRVVWQQADPLPAQPAVAVAPRAQRP
jgi:hypothetical protein